MAVAVHVLAVHIASLLLRAEAAGLERDELLARAGLDAAVLDDPTAPLPLAVFAQLCEHCEQFTGDPLFATHAALASSGEEYGLGYYAITALPDARASMREGARLWQHMANPLRARYEESDGGGAMVYTPIAGAPPAAETYTEMMLALALNVTRNQTLVAVVPEEVRIAHAPRTGEEAYWEAFDVRPRFGSADSAIVFSDAALNLPNRGRNEHLAQLATAEVLRQTEGHYSEGMDLVGMVLVALSAADGPEDWRLETVAARYGLHPRTLQHRLKQKGTTFQALAGSVRRGMSARDLEAGLSLDEVAYRLGYADAGSLRKAFRRWYAVTPGEWRGRRAMATHTA